MKEQHVLDLLHQEGPMSRADIARHCGISKPTASHVVDRLIEAKLVHEVGMTPATIGRPGRLVSIHPEAGYVVALDVGGTTTRAITLDLAGSIVARTRTATPMLDAPGTARHIAAIVDDVTRPIRDAGPTVHVAIGTPGVEDPIHHRILYAPNLPALETPGFLTELGDALPTSFTMLNDVKAATLGELDQGAGVDASQLVYAGIGTGLGFGFVIDGNVRGGAAGRAGEFGLVPYRDGETLEAFVSGAAIAARHRALGGTGSPEDAFKEAREGNAPGVQIIDTFLSDLVWAATALTTTLDPEVFVLGGGIGLQCEPYLDTLHDRVQRAVGFAPTFSVTQLGDDAGLTGAGTVALDAARTVGAWLKGGSLQTTS